MAENLNRTEDEFVGDLKKAIEKAEGFEDCLQCRKCNSILDVLREISAGALKRLAEVDPDKKNEVIKYQQTAKIFDAVALAMESAISEGYAALDLLNQLEGE